jgi:alpha-galactosidase/6-phospho-beta-glucosidase family protein
MMINKAFKMSDIDLRIYGMFFKHLGRCVYNRIYESTHATADAKGSRNNVKELNTALIRDRDEEELSLDDIVALCDDLIEAHGDWLPTFE